MTQDPPKAPARVDTATGLPIRETPPGTSMSADPQREAATLAFCIDAARLLSDDKCQDVAILDLRGRSQITDFFVIASGTSDRQMASAAEHVGTLAKQRGMGMYRSNLDEPRASWFIVDLVDAVIHLLLPQTRLYYDLEMLWGDAPRVAWQRDLPPGAADHRATPAESRNRAGLTPGDILPRSSRG